MLHQTLSQIIERLAPDGKVYLLLAALLGLIPLTILFMRFWRPSPLDAIPLVRAELSDEERRTLFARDSGLLYEEGYKKFTKSGGLFRLLTHNPQPTLVLPPKYLREVVKLPDSVIDTESAFDAIMQSQYLGFPIPGFLSTMAHGVKSYLNPSLARISPTMFEEAENTISKELRLSDASDGVVIDAYETLGRIVTIISSRIFVGQELCYNEQWVEAALNYTSALVKAANAIRAMPPWLRRLKANPYFSPEVAAVRKYETQTKNLLLPIVQSRKMASEADDEDSPDDLFQWTMRQDGMATPARLASLLLNLSFAAIDTSTHLAHMVLHNLAAYPSHISSIRAELRTVLSTNNGVLTAPAMQRLHFLDSFIKESNRTDGAFIAQALPRRARREFTLSDGVLVPAGTYVDFPSVAIAKDSNVWDSAEEFDGFRFIKGEGGDGRNQAVSLSDNYLTFGAGNHACPGRFFAVNEVKMIVAKIIMQFDVEFLKGEKLRDRTLFERAPAKRLVLKKLKI